jgi:hypothetical protein
MVDARSHWVLSACRYSPRTLINPHKSAGVLECDGN